MAVTGDAADFLRALIRQEHEATEQARQRMLDKDFAESSDLVGAAFYVAARRRFPDGQLADIVRWVADLRMQLTGDPDDVDPTAAEHLIRAAVRGETDLAAQVAPAEVADLEIVLTYQLVSALVPTDDELEAFLTEAARVAREWREV
jgi:hypothetical protein